MSSEDFIAQLQTAVARHIGAPGTIHDLQRLTGGANKTTWSFDADVAGERAQFILQLASARANDADNPLAGVSPHLTADEDARLMIAAVKAGVPAPRVRAILQPEDGLGQPDDGLGGGYVTERVAGETLATKILRDERFAGARATMAKQCGTILAAIHRIPVSEVPFLMKLTPAEHIAAQRRIIEYFDFHLPALELGLKWAEQHVPRNARHSVVHGDFRAGNFIVREDGIRCVLDWEIGQSGDPMQDLGWVCVKTWRFGGKKPVGGFGTREDLFEAYEKASGQSVDPAHVRFWEAYGSVRWGIGCLSMGLRGMEEVGIERCAIGRRIEEPLWDFFNLIEGRD
jgi:aminoglycoside phosphotransferase (APT) family kinase protein